MRRVERINRERRIGLLLGALSSVLGIALGAYFALDAMQGSDSAGVLTGVNLGQAGATLGVLFGLSCATVGIALAVFNQHKRVSP